jgi:hypothetical protein
VNDDNGVILQSDHKMGDTSSPPWVKSTYCVDVGCVTIAPLDGFVGICNSSDPSQGVIIISRIAFEDLLEATKAGHFDDILAC